MTSPFVRTWSGAAVALDDPHPASIDIGDIARHLAQLPRFCGAAHMTVNVASHSIHVARELARLKASPTAQLWGLLHDAHEAFTGDIPTPVKRAVARLAGADAIGRLQDGIDRAVMARFGIEVSAGDARQVKAADAAVLAAEWIKWMPGPCPEATPPARIPVEALRSDVAEKHFLALFARLDILRGPRPRHGIMNFDVHGGT